MTASARRIVRYRNRKLYEPAERRFVTLDDLARAVAAGSHLEVRAADTGEDITARILSRALASGRASAPPTTDALTRLLRAGSGAAETVAEVVERVGGTRIAETVRRAAAPERLAETFAPIARRLETARQDVERIVGALVGRGTLTWEEGTRLKEEMGTVLRESLSTVLDRVRALLKRLDSEAAPEIQREISDLERRIEQLESLAETSFPAPAVATRAGSSPVAKKGRTAPTKRRRKTP